MSGRGLTIDTRRLLSRIWVVFVGLTLALSLVAFAFAGDRFARDIQPIPVPTARQFENLTPEELQHLQETIERLNEIRSTDGTLQKRDFEWVLQLIETDDERIVPFESRRAMLAWSEELFGAHFLTDDQIAAYGESLLATLNTSDSVRFRWNVARVVTNLGLDESEPFAAAVRRARLDAEQLRRGGS